MARYASGPACRVGTVVRDGSSFSGSLFLVPSRRSSVLPQAEALTSHGFGEVGSQTTAVALTRPNPPGGRPGPESIPLEETWSGPTPLSGALDRRASPTGVHPLSGALGRAIPRVELCRGPSVPSCRRRRRRRQGHAASGDMPRAQGWCTLAMGARKAACGRRVAPPRRACGPQRSARGSAERVTASANAQPPGSPGRAPGEAQSVSTSPAGLAAAPAAPRPAPPGRLGRQPHSGTPSLLPPPSLG